MFFKDWRERRKQSAAQLRDYQTCTACGNSHRRTEPCPRCAELQKEFADVHAVRTELLKKHERADQRHAELDMRERKLQERWKEISK